MCTWSAPPHKCLISNLVVYCWEYFWCFCMWMSENSFKHPSKRNELRLCSSSAGVPRVDFCAPVRHLDFILDPHVPVRHCYELVYYSSCRMIKVLVPMLRHFSSFSMYKETLMSHNALWLTAGILKPHTSFWEAVIMKQFVIWKDLRSEMWLYCLQGIWYLSLNAAVFHESMCA